MRRGPTAYGAAARLALASLALGFLGASCDKSLVNESYATLGRKSINGIDAFVGLLEAEVAAADGKTFHTGFLTKRTRRDAHVVVFFEQDSIDDPDYYRNLEAYLYGVDPANLEGTEPESGETLAPPGVRPAPDFENVPEGDQDKDAGPGVEYSEPSNAWRPTPNRGAVALMQLDDLETAEEAYEGSGADEQSDEALPGEADGGVIDRYKTILYFLKDTDASVAFWERLAFQMKDYPLQAEYCSGELERREFLRGIEVPPRLAPFSYRSTAFPEARLVRQLRYDRTVLPATRFPLGQLRFPVRTVPGPTFSHFGLDDFERIPSRSLLATFEGADLIRELELPLARLILVYNSESFLNHSMVYSGNRELSQALIRHALRNARNAGMWAPGETLQVALVRNRLMASQEAARDDFDIWRFLKVFPLNVIVFHFLGILLLFLLSRWPHSQPPLENPGSGTREFLEHIRALGARLGRTRSRIKALEPLLKYKQKTTGRDYSAVIQKLEEDAE